MKDRMKTVSAILYAVAMTALLCMPYVSWGQDKRDGVALDGGTVVDGRRLDGIVFGGASAEIALTETDTTNMSNASTTVTWTGKDFGAEAADRVIVCVLHTRVASSTVPSSATIGGQAATLLTVTDDVSGTTYFGCFVFWAAVPTGATGNVVVNGLPNAAVSEVLVVHRMVGCNATAQDSGAVHSSSTLNDTLMTTSGGIVFGAGTNSDTGGANATWSGGVDESQEGNFGIDDTYTTAFGDAVGATMTPQVVFGSGTASTAVFVSFQPL